MTQRANFSDSVEVPASDGVTSTAARRVRPSIPLYAWLVVASFGAGMLVSYLAWGNAPKDSREAPQATVSQGPAAKAGLNLPALISQVNPPDGYNLSVRYGDLGPRLVQAGAIDYNAFAAVFQDGGDPLTPEQVQAVRQGSDQPIVITAANAHFLLNFFWAVGLANKNVILTQGPMVQNSAGRIEGFASTGGWTLGAKPVTDLYASVDLIPLTAEQQQRLVEVAAEVYRPCCGNPTIFPDCNHGMAMLGLLELMASQGAGVDEMLTAAKYVNAYWFPQQALEAAMYLKARSNLDFAQADPRIVVGRGMFSGQGAQQVHAALSAQGLLPTEPGSGGGCGT